MDGSESILMLFEIRNPYGKMDHPLLILTMGDMLLTNFGHANRALHVSQCDFLSIPWVT